jgi:hypothetical protein
MSHVARTLDELIGAIGAALSQSLTDSPAEADRRRRVLEHNIAGLDQALASDRILDIVQGIAAGDTGGGRAWRRQAQRWVDRTFPSARRSKASAPERAIQDHKFPPTPLREVETRIADLGRILGRFEGVGARELAPKIFEIARR